VWILTATGKNMEEGRRPLSMGEEDVKHILLRYSEPRKYRRKFLNKKMADCQ
jgi:hypothetical protein